MLYLALRTNHNQTIFHFDSDDIMAQAPETKDDMIVVPRITTD